MQAGEDAAPGRDGPARACDRRTGHETLGGRRLRVVTAAHDYEDLHHLVDRLTPRQAERLRLLVASDPDLAPEAEPQEEEAPEGPVSIVGIWESGRDDLSERHDEIIRQRLKRLA